MQRFGIHMCLSAQFPLYRNQVAGKEAGTGFQIQAFGRILRNPNWCQQRRKLRHLGQQRSSANCKSSSTDGNAKRSIPLNPIQRHNRKVTSRTKKKGGGGEGS